MTPRSRALLALVVLAALAALEAWRLTNPAAAGADAPADQFSAARAIATLGAVSLDAPHPLGSPAHDAVRDRIAAAFRALGYGVDVQHAFACNASATCSDIDNVIARRPGGAPGTDAKAGKAIVIAAHYDSVPAGPGASDDGTGVATALEIARALRTEPLANPVVFLIDDGEEAGLLGAEGFIADAARSADAAFIINVEARGTTGTPFLFETSRNNRWLVPVMAGALPHPVTTSLFATIYDQLPNDTDLTVFKRAGRAGINFAYLGGASQYHTPLDNFANVDAGSVQRRGDQVLAMVRAFGAAPLSDAAAGAGDAVWFDAFAAFVVWWPSAWSLWIAVAALALLAAAIVAGHRRGTLGVAGVLLGVASFVAALVVALGLGVALARLVGLRAPAALFVPYPEPLIAAAWLAGIAAAVASAGLARRRASFDAIFVGHAVAWNGLAIALAQILPGAAYVAVVPGASMAVLAVLRTRGLREEPTAVAALIVSAPVFLPFALVGYDALGGVAAPVMAAMLAMLATSFAPVLAGVARRVAGGAAALAVLSAAAAMLVPDHSPSHPLHAPIAYVLDGDTGAARWQVSAPTPELRAAAHLATAPRSVAPWYGAYGTAEVAPAPREALAAPEVKVAITGDAARVITLDIASVRQAPRLSVAWHSDAEVSAVRINGTSLPPRPARFHSFLAPGWHRILVRGPSARIEITEQDGAAVDALVSDTSYGLPPSAAPLVEARDASGAVPVHDGDITVIERHVKW